MAGKRAYPIQEDRLVLRADGIVKSFGDRDVLRIDRLQVFDGQRIALIGENGAGKSTLLSILAGEMKADEGQIIRYGGLALIRQSGRTGMEGEGALAGVFRTKEDREGLSGGEETRRRIAAALSGEGALLLADEPGTDLDREGKALLQSQLLSRQGALILVSHDRALLQTVCTSVWHLEDGRITVFPGRYEAWRREEEQRRAFAQEEYDRYRTEKKRLEESARQKREWASAVRKAPKRMGNSEARLHTREYTNAVLALGQANRTLQDRIARLEKKDRPRALPQIRMTLGADDPIRAKTALEGRVGRLWAGDRTLLSDTAFALPAGSRTALIGPNGAGKTTLLRALTDRLLPGTGFEGQVKWNPAARISVYDQDQTKALDLNRTVLENVLWSSRAGEADARSVLARLALKGDAVFKKAGVLSGGERAKTALARVLLSDSNLLILDEPTNHLDLFALEELEGLLAGYGGTLLLVSHDEKLLDAVADRFWCLEGGRIRTFEGTMKEMQRESARDRTAEDAAGRILRLEMRLAALSARLSAPQKGDDPEELDREYRETAALLRAERSGQTSGNPL